MVTDEEYKSVPLITGLMIKKNIRKLALETFINDLHFYYEHDYNS